MNRPPPRSTLLPYTALFRSGTVTLEGTLAAALLLESVTCAPPAGAGPLSVTVPVDDCVPPVTLVGFNVSEETVGRGGGITVSEADVLVPPRSEEHTSELQSQSNLVCRLLLEKKKNNRHTSLACDLTAIDFPRGAHVVHAADYRRLHRCHGPLSHPL